MKYRILRAYYSLCYRWCMVTAYLESHQGNAVIAAGWESAASAWEREIILLDLNRRFA